MPVLRAELLRNKWLLLPIGLCVLLAAGIYAVAGTLEGDDAFCASCHVEPEATYYQHSRAQSPPTLAAFHVATFQAGEGARCIDCHSGRWIPGRLGAQWIGLGNLLAFRSGEYRQPAQTTRPTGDVGCTKCHREMSWVRERPGHYHSPILRRQWQAVGGPASTCAACHPAHQEFSQPADSFLDSDRLEAQCEACHES